MKKPALQRNKSMDKGSKPNPFSAGARTTKKPKCKAGRAAASKSASAKPKGKKAKKQQGYNARLDESLGMRTGKASGKKQNYKARRDESKGMSKAMGRRAYASVGTMDKGKKKRG